MPIKKNSNKLTEIIEMTLTSSGVALTTAGVANPLLGLIGGVVSIAALPFAAYNASLIRKQLDLIIDEFNRLETKMKKPTNLTEDQAKFLLLNEYKFFDYCLKEKMKEKIQAYAKVFSKGISNGTIIEESDLFDIQMDIINSLRIEDIVLLNHIFNYIEKEKLMPYIDEFKKDEIDSFIVVSTNEEESLNEYALRHLINLGLISEKISASLPNTVGDEISFSDDIIFKYSLTQRCKMIRDIIVK